MQRNGTPAVQHHRRRQSRHQELRFPLEMFSNPCGEIRKATEDVSIARDKLAFTILNMCQGAKTIDLQFKDKLVGVEGLRTARKPYRA